MKPEHIEWYRAKFHAARQNIETRELALVGQSLVEAVDKLHGSVPYKADDTRLFVWAGPDGIKLIEATHIAGAQEQIIRHIMQNYKCTSEKAWDRLRETGGVHGLLFLPML